MIQLMSRAGNFSCARAGEFHGPRLPAAATPSAVRPALCRKPRRSTGELLLIPCSCWLREPSLREPSLREPSLREPWRATIRSVRRGQPDPEALLERISIQEVCQCDVLRHKPGGMDQDALVVALAAPFRARDQLLDFGMELFA